MKKNIKILIVAATIAAVAVLILALSAWNERVAQFMGLSGVYDFVSGKDDDNGGDFNIPDVTEPTTAVQTTQIPTTTVPHVSVDKDNEGELDIFDNGTTSAVGTDNQNGTGGQGGGMDATYVLPPVTLS